MKITCGVFVPLAAGGVFGALTSVVNDLSSPYRSASTMVGTDSESIRSTAEVVSLLLDAGWAWAALAVAMGWLARGPARGAAAGAVALVAATAAYYLMDSFLLAEPFSWHQDLMVFWWAVGVVTGMLLGAVGAVIHRPGLVGLLAALTVPVGALAQMALIPPGFGLMDNPEAVWARGIVCICATAAAGIVIARFLRRRRLSAHG